MPEEQIHPIIPFTKAVNLRRIDKLIDKALEKLRQHYDTIPIGPEFDTFVRDLSEVFPPTLRYDVLFASIMTLAGQSLTREVIKYTVWRLAANLPALIKGQPIPPWLRQANLEWVAVKIVRGQLGKSQRGKLGFWYDYRVMSGTPAGLRFRMFWSLKYLRFVAKSAGFSRWASGKFPFRDGIELVGLQLYFLLDPALSAVDRPVHYHFFVPSSCKTANQKILKRRMRILPCPESFSLAEVPCRHCPFGQDHCPAGCHPATYVRKPCPRCQTLEAWFDPVGRGVICIECEDKEIFAKEEAT